MQATQSTNLDTGNSYIYFGNGAQFKIKSLPFEHHERIHFRFVQNQDGSYDLILVDGTRYHFDSSQKLVSITDRTGNNVITFNYNGNNFGSIVDTVGRTVNFNYDGNGKLINISSGGRTVTYGYNGNNLISSADPAGRTTHYEYNSGNGYSLSKITYPTGGFTSYSYKAVGLGEPHYSQYWPTYYDTYIYRVEKQEINTSTPVKKVTYNYTEDGTGKVLNSTISLYDPALLKQTIYYTYDADMLTTSRTITDAGGVQLRKTTYCYNSNKEVLSATEYVGNTQTSTFTVSQYYDNWGNVTAEKDPLGHYVFYSYSNTTSTYVFRGFNGKAVSGFSNKFYYNNIDPNVHNLILGQAMFQEISSGKTIESYYNYTDLQGPSPSPPPDYIPSVNNCPCGGFPDLYCGYIPRPKRVTPVPTPSPNPIPGPQGISGLLVQTKNLHNGGWIYKEFSSDGYGNITSVTEHPGTQSITTSFAYDPSYQSAYLTSITKTLNGQPVTSSFAYDLNTGDVTSITDMNGNTSSYAYDILGRITSVTFADSSSKTASYDDLARMVTITDEKGNWVKKYFDELGRLTIVQNAAGQETYSLNYLGKVITKTNALGHQYTYEYDALGRTKKVTNPDGTYQELVYNDLLFTVTSFDENRHQKDFLYDFKQQLKSVKEYVGASINTTSYVYDGVGNMKSVTDAKNQTTSYAYDDLNRLTKTTYANATSSFLTYDNVGNILSKTDQENQTINYTYDEMNRLTRITYPDATGVTYTYDNNGNRLQMTDPNSSTAYVYDNRNRLTSETKTVDGTPYTTNYAYDNASNLTTIVYPDSQHFSLAYNYDNLNRVSEIPGFVSYGYNALSQITNVGFGNNVQTAYTYDNRNRPTRIQTTKEANNYLDLNYTYDNVGNILQIGNGGSNEIYSYDNLDRLISAQLPAAQTMGQMSLSQPQQQQPSTLTLPNLKMMISINLDVNFDGGIKRFGDLRSYGSGSQTSGIDAASPSQSINYEYDTVGNRTKKNDTGVTTTYNYNNMNQLISMTENGITTNFTYDANGNLVQKQVGGTETWNYVYDYENRLVEIKKNGLTIQKNWYDGDGKRIKKQENGETVVYIYVGIQVIYEKVIESGKETKYIGRVAKIEKVNGNETITFFHTDHLGSTRAVTDSTGNLTATLQYDPFGEVRSESSNGVRYTYTGKEQDATGLYYYGARFYDPEIGRFITKDVLIGSQINPQTQNRYSYVLNNPLKYIDPMGYANEPDDDTEPIIVPGTYTTECKVTKHAVDQIALLESKLRRAMLEMSRSEWESLNAMLATGTPQDQVLATAYILNKAQISYDINDDNTITVTEWGMENAIIIDFINDPEGAYGATYPLKGGGTYLVLNFGRIKKAGDLYLTLGHELIHGCLSIYAPGLSKRAHEAYAIDWTYNAMIQLDTSLVSSDYYDSIWHWYWNPLSWIILP